MKIGIKQICFVYVRCSYHRVKTYTVGLNYCYSMVLINFRVIHWCIICRWSMLYRDWGQLIPKLLQNWTLPVHSRQHFFFINVVMRGKDPKILIPVNTKYSTKMLLPEMEPISPFIPTSLFVVAFVNTQPAIDVESEDLCNYLESIRKCRHGILPSSKLNKNYIQTTRLNLPATVFYWSMCCVF